MHIVIDARFFRRTTGGIGRYTQALIRELARLETNHRYTLLLTAEDVRDWQILQKQEGISKKSWHGESITISHYTVAEQMRLPRVLAKLKPDLVHFTNFNHPITWNEPFVITFHDLTILKYPVGKKQRSPFFQAAFRSVIRHGIDRAKKIITVSETSKQDLVRYLHAASDRIAVTYEGVDSEYQPINLPQRGRIQSMLKDRYGIRAPYLLFVSQWRPHKGILTLLSAYEAFRDAHPRLSAQLVIAGKPNPNYPDIPEHIEKSRYRKDIVTPGFVSETDLPKLYQGAEAFIFPSEYEGFGLTPLEAMASGTPVIASRASCLPEILGSAALLVEPTNKGGWVTAMERLLTDRNLARDLRTQGLSHARTFSWESMAKETLAVYEAAIADRS